TRVTELIGPYSRALAARAEASCKSAPHEPAPLANARSRCLFAHRSALADLLDRFQHADAGTVREAVESAGSLVERAPCADDRAVLTTASTAATFTPDQTMRFAAARRFLEAGHAKQGISLIEPVAAEAHHQADRAGELVALLLLADLYDLDGRNDAAVPRLHD